MAVSAAIAAAAATASTIQKAGAGVWHVCDVVVEPTVRVEIDFYCAVRSALQKTRQFYYHDPQRFLSSVSVSSRRGLVSLLVVLVVSRYCTHNLYYVSDIDDTRASRDCSGSWPVGMHCR